MLPTTNGASACFWCIRGSVYDWSGCLVWRTGHRYHTAAGSTASRARPSNYNSAKQGSWHVWSLGYHTPLRNTFVWYSRKRGIISGLSSKQYWHFWPRAGGGGREWGWAHGKNYLGSLRPEVQPLTLYFLLTIGIPSTYLLLRSLYRRKWQMSYPFIDFNKWNPFPFRYLKPEKGTPFVRSLLVKVIIGSTPPLPGEKNAQ